MCPPCDGEEIFRAVGQRLKPAEKVLSAYAVATVAPAVVAAAGAEFSLGSAISSLGVARPMLGRTILPVVSSAIPKLQELGQKFGMSATRIANAAIVQGAKLVDNAERNAGNINALLARPDGVSGWIRVTLDPSQSRIISAGLQTERMVSNGIASGRFSPLP